MKIRVRCRIRRGARSRASVVLAVFLASGATWFVLRPGPADATADMIVASHVRALMAPQPFDVASSDRHTVKPWFNGRIADAPRVVDLADQGFPWSAAAST